jgi:hypothetical protein
MNKRDLILCATHIPVLVRAFTLSDGDVLELGVGLFSTPLLRNLCEMSGRTLYSYENKQRWYDVAVKDPKPYHNVFMVDDYTNAPIERRWGLAFVDHSPGKRRQVEIRRLASFAEYIVIHDTNPEFDKEYRYHRIWPLFKYRYHFTKYFPFTSIVSNFHSLEKFEL